MRIRTGYSFRTAFGHLKQVASRLEAIGWERQPISDRLSTFAFTKWSKLVKAPLYGVEIPVTANPAEKKPVFDYWTFFAIDDLDAINVLINDATWSVGKTPCLTYEAALAAEGVVKICGERVNTEKLKGKHKHLYAALAPSLPKALYAELKKLKVPFVASSDNYYPTPEDKEIYRIALGWRSGTQTYAQYILSDAEWDAELEWFTEEKDRKAALSNRAKLFKLCKAELKKASLFQPEKTKTLRELCEEGALRTGTDLSDPVYKARLDRELELIAEKKFEDYFYIIADLVQFAKTKMIVGPARGSSCGSLVCYLLDITTVDPIPFGLIFERFIDTTRADLPDIDIDFSDAKRDLVFEYAEQKYGKDHVARLGTVGMFKPRSVMGQAGKALRIPKWQVDKVLDGLIERSLGDSRALQTLTDTFTDTEAGRKLLEDFPEIKSVGSMEGHPNNSSQHAAGIVLTQEPVLKYVAVDARTKSTMCDKYDAETLNLLKIDALGLTQLSIFERTLELIGEKPVSGWLEKLPLDDQSAFDVLNAGHFSGIFQFNGSALQSLVKQTKINQLEDMIAITALARPGPMATGGANLWVKRRNGEEPVTYFHPLLEPYLKQTLGIVVYQEQVLEIGRNIGDLTWAQVTQLRKAMSKSLGKEYFDQFGDPWKVGAMKRGIPKDVADEIWDSLCSMGSWAFNRSHAVAYGLVSYYCCWLKAHHRSEFAAATLDAESDPQRQITILRELRGEGIDYVPIDKDKSTDRWAIRDDGVLVGPLTAIKGIGPAAVNDILTARRTGKELRPSLAKLLESGKTEIDTLTPIADAVAKVNAVEIIGTSEPPTPINELIQGTTAIIFALATRIALRDENDAAKVAQRGGRLLKGKKTMALNMFVRDDTEEIFCKIGRFDYDLLAKDVVENGRPGKTIYAIKGKIPSDKKMMWVSAIKKLTEIDNVN